MTSNRIRNGMWREKPEALTSSIQTCNENKPDGIAGSSILGIARNGVAYQ
jgi:hypothetical protein